MDKYDLKSMNIDELAEMLSTLKQPSFRAKQIFDWLHVKKVVSFEEMSNLPKALQEKLGNSCYITKLETEKKLVSKTDETTKYLFKLDDGEYVESVLMKYKYGNSVCISTQVGCKMGCEFCASTKAGFIRNLKTSEILEQVYSVIKDNEEKISSIVLMGIGEPLDNYDNVVRFLNFISCPEGQNLSLRHVSLSTCGIVNKIYDLAKLRLGLTLSISLHAPNDIIRSKTMPINNKWGIDELILACKEYTKKTSRRISFEYALIKDVNDMAVCAEELAFLLKGMLCHVNLIPINEIKESDYKKSTYQNANRFKELLLKKGINATIRRTLGEDIDAACGQLRRENL